MVILNAGSVTVHSSKFLGMIETNFSLIIPSDGMPG
jgi:hypothetical protein